MKLFSVRRVDELGRIVLPMELRQKLMITANTPLDIFIDNNGNVVLRKTTPYCSVCGETKNLTELGQKNAYLCSGCIGDIKNLYL